MKLKLLVAIAAILGVLVIWQLTHRGAPPISSIDARMEELRQAGDVEALAAEAKSPDLPTARRAVQTLGYAGPKAVKHIRLALQDPRPEIRQHAARAYARTADPKNAAPLAQTARSDKSSTVRAAAITALGRARVYSEMETLLDAMNDENILVRRRAADAVVPIIGRRYPYDPNASSAQRLKSIAVIRKFWTRVKGEVAEYYDNRRKSQKP
jgi:HEAT repeat protein